MVGKVVIEDWLAIYELPDGHTAVRSTELWPDWGKVGRSEGYTERYLEERKRVVRFLAEKLGPPAHDPRECEKCLATAT
jgi:hypothetical protein